MIKDSKLIGTKIAAPFGWKKFKVGELFDFKSSMSLNKSDLKFVSKQDSFAIPYITRTVLNNGINGYVDSRLVGDEYINDGGEFAFGLLGLVAFYQCNRYCTGQFVKRFVPKFELNDSLAMFFKTLLDNQIELFKTVAISSYNKLINDVLDIELPITSSNQPDFEWISAYIKAVKADYLEQKELSNQREIKDYLIAGKVDSMDVTDSDRQFLRDFEKLPRRKFKVGELFDFKSSMPLNKSDLKFVSKQNPFAIPYITRTVLNNGINGYVDSRLVGDEYINDGGEFAFGLLGLVAFYQCDRYCTGQFVKRFVPKFELNDLLAMFFKTLLDKQIELFKTVSISSYNKLINDVLDIELPVIVNDEIDVHSIEKYMQIQVKLTIAKRKSYLDHELELMNQV